MLVYHYVLEHLHQILNRPFANWLLPVMSPPQRFYDFVTKWAMLVFELKYAVKEEAKQTQTFENFYDATVHVDAFKN